MPRAVALADSQIFRLTFEKDCPPMGTHRCRDNEADLGTSRRQLGDYVIAI